MNTNMSIIVLRLALVEREEQQILERQNQLNKKKEAH